MNFQNMPELTWQYGQYVTLAIIAAVRRAVWRFKSPAGSDRPDPVLAQQAPELMIAETEQLRGGRLICRPWPARATNMSRSNAATAAQIRRQAGEVRAARLGGARAPGALEGSIWMSSIGVSPGRRDRPRAPRHCATPAHFPRPIFQQSPRCRGGETWKDRMLQRLRHG